ncbi:SH3 domain-containing protein [Streptomyces lydicus]|nr:SH3 domain-containing protein [Streptomyces lydicus]
MVTAKTGLSQRQYPSTDSSVRGHLHHRAQVGLVCKVRTQSVGGNTVWYLTREERATWVSARYVTSNGPVRFCKDVQRGRLLLPPGAAKHAVG